MININGALGDESRVTLIGRVPVWYGYGNEGMICGYKW